MCGHSEEVSDENYICPYCKYEHSEIWDWVSQGKHQCQSCFKTFEFEKDVNVSYISRPVDQDTGEET